jgi:M6 family metalloprotease-like protein
MLKNGLYKAAVIILVLAIGCGNAPAMPASPEAFEARQDNGRVIRLHIRGDERFHWLEDTGGYTVIHDGGRYSYARLDRKGMLQPGPLTVGIDDPKAFGLEKRILPAAPVRRSLWPERMDGTGPAAQPAGVPPTGTVKNLVVLCMFSDHTLGADAREAADYDVLFNQAGGDETLAPTGSVKDLYLENSYGTMTLESTVTAWVTLPNTESYYANSEDGTGTYPRNAQAMVEDALDLVDPLVDFSQFDGDGDGYVDAIDIIHSGYGAETGGGNGNWIWSHRWSLWALPGGEWTSAEGVRVYDYHTEPALWGTSGTGIVRFGVIAHETGHFFGLPDLYDTDGSGNGLGSWALMANSWGFDNSQRHPPHFCAWSKIRLGWVAPTVISAPGLYGIDQLETSAQAYRIDYGYPAGEYLLIENRQPAGIETAIPQGGLCIYHVDEQAEDETEGYPGQSGWPQNGNHYRVALLQADGNYDLEKGNNRGDAGDVYHAAGTFEISPATVPDTHAYQGGNIVITDNAVGDVSAAGASMSFFYNNGTVPLPPQAYDTDLITPADTAITITLEAVDDGMPDPPSALTYTIISLPNQGYLADRHGTAITSAPHALANNENEVVYTPRPGCRATAAFDFSANDGGIPPDGGDSNPATVAVKVVDVIYSADMDTDPGFIYTGHKGQPYWEWGTPTGSGGAYGNPDPTSGYTGSNVVGYNLSGDYKKINPTQWAATPAMDCTGKTGVTLRFHRWLNVEGPTYDHAYVEISNDGTAWTTIWENSAEVTDSSWKLQSFDVSAFADDQPTVHVRWGMGVTDPRWHYSGWNIDDVMLFASDAPELAGDFEPDCDVDLNDLAVMAGHWLEQCGNCGTVDLLPDDTINLGDFGILAENWLRQL